MRLFTIIFNLVWFCEIPESIYGVPAKAPTYRPTGTPNKPTTKPTNKPPTHTPTTKPTASHRPSLVPTRLPTISPTKAPTPFVCPAGQYSSVAGSTTCIKCPAGTSSIAGGSCTNCPITPHEQSSVAGGPCLDTCTSTDTNCAVALKSGTNGACVCVSCNDGTIATRAGCPVSTCYEAAYDLNNNNSTCDCLTAVFPPGIRSINDYAFNSCPITSAVIPDSVTTIGLGAFIYCYFLESIVVPNTITNIGEEAFFFMLFLEIYYSPK